MLDAQAFRQGLFSVVEARDMGWQLIKVKEEVTQYSYVSFLANLVESVDLAVHQHLVRHPEGIHDLHEAEQVLQVQRVYLDF